MQRLPKDALASGKGNTPRSSQKGDMVTKRPREYCAGPSAAALGLAPQEQCLPSREREATSDVRSAWSQTTGARHPARAQPSIFWAPPSQQATGRCAGQKTEIKKGRRARRRDKLTPQRDKQPAWRRHAGPGLRGRPGRRRHEQRNVKAISVSRRSNTLLGKDTQ